MRELGERGEELACAFLRRKGWEIEDRNYTEKIGEIDIVARRELDGGEGTLVAFVEVKARSRADQTAPELSVTARKRRTITRVARLYVSKNELPDRGYRFDIISVDLSQEPPAITHFEGAFDARGNPY